MSVFDKIIQDKEEHEKFLGYAEKATTEARRIELCKKYLEAKKAMPEPEYNLFPMPNEIQYIYPNVELVQISTIQPAYRIDIGENKKHVLAAVHRDMMEKMMHELLRKGYVKFQQDFLAYEQDYLFSAKLRIYKEPNNGK